MPKIADRVKDITTSATSGNITLANTPPSGFVGFFTPFTNGDVVYYCIAHQSANEWEVGYGTLSGGNTLSRDTILANSDGNTTAHTFSAGTKDVFNVVPAGFLNGVLDFLTAQVFI